MFGVHWLFDNENNVVSSAGSFPNGKRIIKEYINIIRKSNKNNNVGIGIRIRA